MSEENKERTDVKDQVGDVGQQQTGTDDSAGGQQVVSSDAGSTDEITGLKSAYQAEKEKRQATEAQLQAIRDQMAILQANQPVQPAQRPQSFATGYEQALHEAGLDQEEYISESQRIQVIRRANEIEQQRQQQQFNRLTTQQFISQNADVSELVGTINPITGQFVPSAEFSKLLAKSPNLINLDLQTAYNIARGEREKAELKKKAVLYDALEAQRNQQNRTSPLSASAVSGGAGLGTLEAQLAKASPDDIKKLEQEIEAGMHG